MRAGEELPPLEKGVVTLAQVHAYEEAVQVSSPIHVDDEAARAAGLDGVIAHGPMIMGFLAQHLVGIAGPEALRRLAVRFTATVPCGDELTCRAVVREVADGRARLDVWAENQRGERVASGEAEIAL